MKPLILIADDEFPFHQNLIFSFDEYRFISVYSIEEAIEIIQNVDVQLVISDVIFNEVSREDRDGITLIQSTKQHKPNLPIIAVSKYLKVDNVSEELKKAHVDHILDKKTLHKDKSKWKETIDELLSQSPTT